MPTAKQQVYITQQQILTADYQLLQLKTASNDWAAGHYLTLQLGPTDKAHVIIMRDTAEHLECLYQGPDLQHLVNPARPITASLHGTALNIDHDKSAYILLSQDYAMASLIACAAQLRQQHNRITAFLQFNQPSPFVTRPSQILLPACPSHVLACLPLLEDWHIASRLCYADRDGPCPAGYFEGTAVELLRDYWQSLSSSAQHNTQLLCCGSDTFIQQANQVAGSYNIAMSAARLPKPQY